jgi:hypothetical protein
VVGHLDGATVLASDHIEVIVVFRVEVLRAHHRTHTRIVVDLLQSLTVFVVLVVERDNVIGRATLILLCCAIDFCLGLKASLLLLFFILHVVPSVEISL